MVTNADIVSEIVGDITTRPSSVPFVFVSLICLLASHTAESTEATSPQSAKSNYTLTAPGFHRSTSWQGDIEVRFAPQRGHLATDNFGTRLGEAAAFAVLSVPVGLITAFSNPFAIFVPVQGVATIPMGQIFRQQQDMLLSAMSPETFGNQIADALVRRLETSRLDPKPRKVLFTVSAYGLVAKTDMPGMFSTDKELCLVLDGALDMEPETSAGRTYRLQLYAEGRTPPLPPPHCAPFNSLADDEANLMRQLMQELAQVIGAWTIYILSKH